MPIAPWFCVRGHYAAQKSIFLYLPLRSKSVLDIAWRLNHMELMAGTCWREARRVVASHRLPLAGLRPSAPPTEYQSIAEWHLVMLQSIAVYLGCLQSTVT